MNESFANQNTESHPQITVRGLRRSFRSVKKKEGLAGTLGLLFKPEYQVHEALKGVSFEIAAGEFVGLIGANGAGKTTLLKILSGLIPPTSGEATVLGLNPFSRTLDFRKRIALVLGQKAQLWWDLPAVDAFDLLRSIYEIPVPLYKDRLGNLSELLDVSRLLNTQIRRLSLGERMKMELIGALLHWPKIIFLDEPTIGLDVLASKRLRRFLKEFNDREKATIILTSHNMDDIEELCPRVLIMQTGQLLHDGSPKGLTRNLDSKLRVQFVELPSVEDLLRTTGLGPAKITMPAKDAEEDSDRNSAVFSAPHDRLVSILQALMTSYRVSQMGVEETSLEDVVQSIYEAEKAQ
ncbi:MAG: ATP-binding cassette domain-containing protein [Bdellovibrionota bacterium]